HDGAVDPGEFDPHDGITDRNEPALSDGDSDGLTNLEELHAGLDPDDADSDDDGILDGFEANWSADGDGDGLINALDPDSDNDGLADATETGVRTATNATDLSRKRFVPDANSSTTTSMILSDTDHDSLRDGLEDWNYNGAVDAGELDPNDPSSPLNDESLLDRDNDGLSDLEEEYLRTRLGSSAPTDMADDGDNDDDGVLDGDEPNWWDDQDRDTFVNMLDFDSDDDCTFDGTELGMSTAGEDTNVAVGNFVPDADPGSTTWMLINDSDRDGFPEDREDFNCNGAVDPGESDPNNPLDPEVECREDDDCPGERQICIDFTCVGVDYDIEDETLEELEELDGEDLEGAELSEQSREYVLQGGSCSCQVARHQGSSAPAFFGLLLLGALLFLRRRPR
ncbi:MAG: MYXO-CTERM sorting domain-containing protein, partial [Myxococcota bacterium]|nr:MYXO-CTERM sorting domain-containing protein [Myxococcota bacterium]